MEFPALKKFIEVMDIEVLYTLDRSFLSSTGKRYICIEVKAYYRKKETYRYYHCWEFTNQGLETYEEGNELIGAGDGIFAYLGSNDMVNLYFKVKSLDYAKKVFKKLQ